LEIDRKYAEKAADALRDNFLEEKWFDIIQTDVVRFQSNSKIKPFDMIMMNPPFGTKNNEGIDVNFLFKANQVDKYKICL
jgi:tRNA1(Val) A37 N6-methylase TrmN6